MIVPIVKKALSQFIFAPIGFLFGSICKQRSCLYLIPYGNIGRVNICVYWHRLASIIFESICRQQLSLYLSRSSKIGFLFSKSTYKHYSVIYLNLYENNGRIYIWVNTQTFVGVIFVSIVKHQSALQLSIQANICLPYMSMSFIFGKIILFCRGYS